MGTAPGLKYEALEGGVVRLIIRGKLDAEEIGSVWKQIVGKVVASQPPRVEVDAHHMEGCDGAGIALLQELKDRQESAGREFRIEGLRRELAELMNLFAVGPALAPGPRSPGSYVFLKPTGNPRSLS